MKAVLCERFGSYRDLVIAEHPMPRVGPGQVRLQAAYASVSFAITLMTAGRYQRKSTPPFVPGSEVAGVIDMVADDVTNFAVGTGLSRSCRKAPLPNMYVLRRIPSTGCPHR